MRVGRLRQVVPESLQFYFEVVRRDTLCHGATLELIDVEARAKCLACETEWELGEPLFRCPACSSAEVIITAGQELEVEYIEVDEPRPSVSRPTR